MPDTKEELPPHFAAVAKEHGREMFDFVWGCSMCSVAAADLQAVGAKLAEGSQISRQNSQRIGKALLVMVDYFNMQGTAYAELRGWTQAQLEACDAAIQQAWALHEAPRVQLVH